MIQGFQGLQGIAHIRVVVTRAVANPSIHGVIQHTGLAKITLQANEVLSGLADQILMMLLPGNGQSHHADGGIVGHQSNMVDPSIGLNVPIQESISLTHYRTLRVIIRF